MMMVDTARALSSAPGPSAGIYDCNTVVSQSDVGAGSADAYDTVLHEPFGETDTADKEEDSATVSSTGSGDAYTPRRSASSTYVKVSLTTLVQQDLQRVETWLKQHDPAFAAEHVTDERHDKHDVTIVYGDDTRSVCSDSSSDLRSAAGTVEEEEKKYGVLHPSVAHPSTAPWASFHKKTFAFPSEDDIRREEEEKLARERRRESAFSAATRSLQPSSAASRPQRRLSLLSKDNQHVGRLPQHPFSRSPAGDDDRAVKRNHRKHQQHKPVGTVGSNGSSSTSLSRLCKFGNRCSNKKECMRAHTFDEWTPGTCHFDRQCRTAADKCRFLHAKETKQQYLQRIMEQPDNHFYFLNSNAYKKNFRL